MEVLVWLSWHVVVNDHIDLFNINTSSEKIGRHQDSIFVLFELSVDSQSVFDLHGRVAGSTWEPGVTDDLVKFFGVFLSFHKDDNLVEVQIIEELDELLDFLVFLKSHVELLQTEEGEIFLLINENLLWVLHVHSADILSLRRHGGWEHHDLSVGVSSHEDLLNLGSHVFTNECMLENQMETFYLPVSSSILSHSSKTKTSRLSSLRVCFLTKARTLPGVPMIIWGHFSLSLKSFSLSYIGTPPKTTAHLNLGRYLVNLSNSFLI